MTEDFVTFEIAKILKEKGFNYPCINAINPFKCTYRNGWCEYLDNREGEYITQKDLKEGDYLLPTIPQVLKWLREEKTLHIEVDIKKAYPGGNLLYWGFVVVDTLGGDLLFFEHNRDSYEAAALAGIEYTLDNII